MKKFVLSKKYWIGALFILIVFLCWYVSSLIHTAPTGIEIGVARRDEVTSEVSETGFVNAAQSLDMAFEHGGRVTDILVTEGSDVKKGDSLVQLDTTTAAADVTTAYARLAAERERLQELQTGADSTSLAITQSSVQSAQTGLDNAKRNLTEVTAQQNQLVANAVNVLRNSDLKAYLISEERGGSTYSYAEPTITGAYTSDVEGLYRLRLYNSSAVSGASYRVTGLETDTEPVSTVNPSSIGTKGLHIQFPINFAQNTQWEIPIPNTRSTNYLTNLNAYKSVRDAHDVAIATAENAVKAAQATLTQGDTQLAQVSGAARYEKIAAQKALVTQMEAAVQSAQHAYDNMTLRAPFDGVVTHIVVNPGQIIAPTVPILSLITDKQYELKVDISEVDIANLSLGDQATVQFDAYKDDQFKAHVTEIAPSATLVDGVRVFEVTLAFDAENEKIRDGLSANIDITTAKKENVIAIPTRAIFEDAEGKFVRVAHGNQFIKTRIATGLRGSNGKTEIVEGLQGGETIITFASEAALAQIDK